MRNEELWERRAELTGRATVLVMGPIAHGVATSVGVDSSAFLMAVAIGAS